MFRAESSKTLFLISALFLFNCILCIAVKAAPQRSVQSGSGPEKKTIQAISAGPDLILHNAHVLTLDDAQPNAEAVAIQGNHILAVGTDAEILALQGTNTQVIDLEQRTVLPGFIDNHTHRMAMALQNGGPENLIKAAQDMAADGYTTVHSLYSDPGFIETVRQLAANDELAVRINCYIPYNTNGGELVVPWQTYPYTENKDSTLRIVGVKIFADGGSIGAAALTTIYQAGEAEGTHGNIFMTQEEMNTAISEVYSYGYPVAMHALGDSGVVIGLNGFEYAAHGSGNGIRSRMEHCRVMREDLVDQMADLGIVASIQYTWATAGSAFRWESLFLPEVLEWVYPWRRMADKGITIAGGNDFPWCSRTHAMQCISQLATRKSQAADVVPDWMAGDELTIEEGIRGMTVTNAWVVFEEDVKGTITPGKLADLTIVSDDPLSMDPYDVRNISIEMTVMNGVIRHDQMGKMRVAEHDAGTFHMGIDDRGLWGVIRAPSGLLYQNRDHLYWGSVLISYDQNTIATAVWQEDYTTVANGWIHFDEPGVIAAEEATAVYEDAVEWHPGKIEITQKTYMWKNEPFLLVKYNFRNVGLNDLTDIYFGQYMDFDVGDYSTNMGGWGTVDGTGFSYMYDGNDAATPYIGMVFFDAEGNTANTSFGLPHGANLDSNNETWTSDLMRSGDIASNATEMTDYAMISSAGPYNVKADSSISPFFIAFAAGDSYAGLEAAVRSAIDHAALITDVKPGVVAYPAACVLHQNYPNPYNGTTQIMYDLPASAQVTMNIYNLQGSLIKQYVRGVVPAGSHMIQWDGRYESGMPAASGIYIYRIEAELPDKTIRESRKMMLIK